MWCRAQLAFWAAARVVMLLWYLWTVFFAQAGDPNTREYATANQPVENYFTRWNQMNSNTPILGDSNWVGSWPDDQDWSPGPASSGIYETGVVAQDGLGSYMGRFTINRHDWKVNVSTVDGSARHIRLAELWTLMWNRNSDSPHVRDDVP